MTVRESVTTAPGLRRGPRRVVEVGLVHLDPQEEYDT